MASAEHPIADRQYRLLRLAVAQMGGYFSLCGIGALFGNIFTATLSQINGSDGSAMGSSFCAAAARFGTGLFPSPTFSLPITPYWTNKMTDVASGYCVATIAIAAK